MMIMDFHRLIVGKFGKMNEICLEKLFQSDDVLVEEVILEVSNNSITTDKTESLLENFAEIKSF